MLMEIIIPPCEPLLFREASLKDQKGSHLLGSVMLQCKRDGFLLNVRQVNDEMWKISYRHYHFRKETVFITKEECSGLRMEIVLAGVLPVQVEEKKPILLRAGHYHITDSSHYQSRFVAKSECRCIVIYFSPGLVNSAAAFASCRPRFVKSKMNDLVIGLLNNTYRENLQSFFIDNCVREIMFRHLALEETDIPGGLSQKQYAAVIAADNIIAVDLGEHHSIRSLSKQVGINEYILKKGFKKVFAMGPFERLMQRRMNKACELMEDASMPLKQIACEAGYSTYHGFSTGFKRKFKVTPSKWVKRFED